MHLLDTSLTYCLSLSDWPCLQLPLLSPLSSSPLLQIAEIPKLTAGCNSFLDEAHTVLEKRRTNRTMLACHPALLDLLEIPQLMDT